MNSRNVTFTLLLILAIIIFAIVKRRFFEPQRKEIFNRTVASLKYTAFALCRMECNGVSKEVVAEIVQKGIINFSKSDRRYRPCPVFALQGRTSNSRQYLRVMVEQCGSAITVLNCYNLEKDATCDCPDYPVKKQN
jgi:hypothetical protein